MYVYTRDLLALSIEEALRRVEIKKGLKVCKIETYKRVSDKRVYTC